MKGAPQHGRRKERNIGSTPSSGWTQPRWLKTLCLLYSQSGLPKEGRLTTETLQHPFKIVSVNFLWTAGRTIVPFIDKDYVTVFSHNPEVIQLRSTTSQATINALKSVFARHGIPEQSDNSPQFSYGEFAEFAENYRLCAIPLAAPTILQAMDKQRQSWSLHSYPTTMGWKITSRITYGQEQLLPSPPDNWEPSTPMARLQASQWQPQEKVKRLWSSPPESENYWTSLTTMDTLSWGWTVNTANTPLSYIVETQNMQELWPTDCSTTNYQQAHYLKIQ